MAQAASWPLLPSADPWLWVEGLSWLHGEWIQAREGRRQRWEPGAAWALGSAQAAVLSLTPELQLGFPAAATWAAAPPQAQCPGQEGRCLLPSSCWAHSTGLQTWALNCPLNKLQIMLLYRTSGIFVSFGFTVYSSSSDQ